MEDNKKQDILFDALNSLNLGQLDESIAKTRQFMLENPFLRHDVTLDGIENDYRLMLDYMKKGYKDPDRNNIHSKLLKRMYGCIVNLRIAYKRRNVQGFIDADRVIAGKSFTNDGILSMLENYVSDQAMLSLEPDETKAEKSRQLYERHFQDISALFNYLLLQPTWNHSDYDFYEQLLLSPMIDSIDAQIIVSGITLSQMENYDIYKFKLLLSLYHNSTSEPVRQRALVGWLLGLNTNDREEERALIEEVSKDANTVRDVLDTQKQIIFCMQAQDDNKKIDKEILSTLIKNQDFKITQDGIFEKEEDPMEDILDPGAADRRMEEIEESVQIMMNMQKAGSDIYFGGFSQMKRFSFFYQMVNWFCPFYLEHPGISQVVKKFGHSKFLVNLLNNGPFCESDKYSLTLGLSSILDKIPATMKEMLDNAEEMNPEYHSDQIENPAYIRRMYLQDLYRFSKLFTRRNDFQDAFNDEHFMFSAHPYFHHTPVKDHYEELCQFLMRQKNQKAFSCLLEKWNDYDDLTFLKYEAYYNLMRKKYVFASPIISTLLKYEPDDIMVLKMKTKVAIFNRDWDSALSSYDRLHTLKPDNKNYTLNYCIALCHKSMYDEASSLLFKLEYEYPDNVGIQRALAWAQLGQKKVENAERIYEKMLKSSDVATSDYLNLGYCKWIKGEMEKALSLMNTYLDKVVENGGEETLAQDFFNDSQLLQVNGISEIDRILMVDLINRERRNNSDYSYEIIS